ncbi:hypothetical protein [Lentzea sp. NPDC051838]|uniref:hypothetical protein n=1 Tax=Lentzea sp. NPDC051838 TaxID=3154849 RepID=UPI00343E871A
MLIDARIVCAGCDHGICVSEARFQLGSTQSSEDNSRRRWVVNEVKLEMTPVYAVSQPDHTVDFTFDVTRQELGEQRAECVGLKNQDQVVGGRDGGAKAPSWPADAYGREVMEVVDCP